MNTFEYVQLFDIVAVLAIGALVCNLMIAVAKFSRNRNQK